MLSHRNIELKQILQNTRDLMKHFDMQEQTIQIHELRMDGHAERLLEHDERLADIEQALIERGVLKSGQLVVPSADAVRIAASEDMTVRELYAVLSDRGIIQPSTDRTSTVMRINGTPVRVIKIGRTL